MNNFFDFIFWQNFVSNALATIVGVIAGIPVALLINRRIKSKTEKQRKKKILTLLEEELSTNLEELNYWWKVEGTIADATGILSVVLRDEIWRSFSDGGELRWIKDPELLSRVANAYQNVQIMRKMADKYSENVNTVWEHIEDMYKNSEQAIRDTLQIIKEKST